ncbi:Protein of unknown function [Pyronema omphalodes CBS 100304]|uniref:Uncharacterized protein n=1 Tax=Pyronema omphalodes (strain CBS 100304) TaxID=1076935 RepID=U4KUE8_PYROM|nr:Protein of unknown function [Pyronema omphalodes CBS 100304]
MPDANEATDRDHFAGTVKIKQEPKDEPSFELSQFFKELKEENKKLKGEIVSLKTTTSIDKHIINFLKQENKKLEKENDYLDRKNEKLEKEIDDLDRTNDKLEDKYYGLDIKNAELEKVNGDLRREFEAVQARHTEEIHVLLGENTWLETRMLDFQKQTEDGLEEIEVLQKEKMEMEERLVELEFFKHGVVGMQKEYQSQLSKMNFKMNREMKRQVEDMKEEMKQEIKKEIKEEMEQNTNVPEWRTLRKKRKLV